MQDFTLERMPKSSACVTVVDLELPVGDITKEVFLAMLLMSISPCVTITTGVGGRTRRS